MLTHLPKITPPKTPPHNKSLKTYLVFIRQKPALECRNKNKEPHRRALLL
ncbi:hypothetical protein [Caudoviricetes sp.]|nr:hypothetical protein [Caudoviricetes sp.]